MNSYKHENIYIFIYNIINTVRMDTVGKGGELKRSEEFPPPHFALFRFFFCYQLES